MRAALLIVALSCVDGLVLGQDPGWQNANSPRVQSPAVQQAQPAYPEQGTSPQEPRLQRRLATDAGGRGAEPANAGRQQQPPPPEFVLTPVDQRNLDNVLLFWQQCSQKVNTFHCKFMRYEYNPLYAPRETPNKEISRDEGELRYASPDKAYYSVDPPAPTDKSQLDRRERFVCDGKSIFEYDYQNKRLVEYKLEPEMQGTAIANGPVPFLFGAKANDLKHRYWIRINTPADRKNEEVWLEAAPKFQYDAQNFSFVRLILSYTQTDIQPTAVEIWNPDGKSHMTYVLSDKAVNKTDFRRLFGMDPFRPQAPAGWQKVIDDSHSRGSSVQRTANGNATPSVGARRANAPQ